MLRTFLLATLFVISSLSGSAAQSVLTNGGFEQSPPNKYGNNIDWSIAPWVLGAGQTNVVSVDGPGGQTSYGNLGPESDATGGAGNMQHYFDQANISGMGIISQEFTPKCTGEVKYGTYFSSRSGADGNASVSILDSNGTIVSGPASVTVPRGNSEKDPWQLAAFTASLTANTTYIFQVGMDNDLNMDNAYVAFETECDAHQPPCFLDGSCDDQEVHAELKKTCKPATRAADGSWALSCKIEISAEKPFPPQTVVYDKFSMGGNLAQLAITSATSTDPWTCRHSAVVPNSTTEFACVMNAADMPASGQSSIDVTLTLPAGSETADVENCTDGKYSATANSGRIDESCVAIEFEETPKPDQTAAICIPFKQGAAQCDTNTGGTIITLTNTALQSFNPKDIRIVSMTPGVVVSQNPANPLEMAVTGGTPGQVIKIKTEAVEIGGGQSLGSDLCCMGEMTVIIPKDELCETPLDLSVEKVWHDFLDLSELDPSIAGSVPPHGFQVTVDLPTGQLEPGDVITVNDPAADQVGITGFGAPVAPAPWTCTLSGQSWSCSYTVSATGAILPANIFWSAAKSPEDPAKNCATTEVTRNGSILGEITLANNRSCWTQNQQQDGSSDLSIAKSGPAQCRTGEPCQFIYTVSNDGTGDYSGPISLDDIVTKFQLSGSGNFGTSGGQFSSITPPLCAVADLESGVGCTGMASIPAGGSQTYTVTYSPPIFDGEGEFAIKNCVTLIDATMVPDEPGSESCHSTEITKPQLEIVKSGPAVCMVGEVCDFTVTINNTSSTLYSGPVLISDTTTVSQFAISAVTPMPTGCGSNLPANPFVCVTNISLAAGASTTYTLSMSPLSAGGQVVAESGENCAYLGSLPQGTPEGDQSIQFYGDGTPTAPQSFLDLLQSVAPMDESCVRAGIIDFMEPDAIEPKQEDDQPKPEEVVQAEPEEEQPKSEEVIQTKPEEAVGKPNITLVKSSGRACSVNVASQRYTCDFQLEVKNEGDAAFSGPMVLDDVFGSPKPTAINNVSGDGWSCTKNGLSGTSCINGALNLAPQQSSTVSMQLRLPGRRDGGRFENCGTIGVGSDETQQAMIAQTALNQIGFNVGGVDGKIGPKTRTALKDLQKQLGINPTGEVTSDFFKAIGLQMAAEVEPSCVTVDLPPMPLPPLVCQASTARKVGNKCACRYRKMYKKNKSSCGCVKGTKFVKGQGCRKIVVKPKCDRATARAKGASCQCRYRGMIKKRNGLSCYCGKGSKFVRGEGCIKQRKRKPQKKRTCPRGTINLKGICVRVNIGIGIGGGGKPKRPSRPAACEDPTGHDC